MDIETLRSVARELSATRIAEATGLSRHAVIQFVNGSVMSRPETVSAIRGYVENVLRFVQIAERDA